MIYAAAILVIIYISIKLLPVIIEAIGALFGGVMILREMEKDTAPKEQSGNSIEERILSSYSSYQDFRETYNDFHFLSSSARKKIERLFERENNDIKKSSAEIEWHILSTYTSYQHFQESFEDFHLLSRKARKKVKKLFEEHGR